MQCALPLSEALEEEGEVGPRRRRGRERKGGGEKDMEVEEKEIEMVNSRGKHVLNVKISFPYGRRRRQT